MYVQAIMTGLVLSAVFVFTPAHAQSRACDRMHHDYERSDGPKAWAVGPGGCGYASGRSASSLGEARRKAYDACSENSRGCRVVEEERR